MSPELRSPSHRSFASRAPRPRELAWIALVALLYFAVANRSLGLHASGGAIALIWPASGLLVAALWSFERRLRPALLAGAWLASFAANAFADRDWPTSMALSVADIGECWLAAFAVERVAGRTPTFTRLREVVALGVFAGGVAPLLGATFGAAILSDAFGAPFFATLVGWWVAAGVAMLVVAPAIVAWRTRDRHAWTRLRILEGLGLLAGLALVAHLVFSARPNSTAAVLLAPHAVLPLMIWVAVRFEPREASLALLLVATATVSYTASGLGPFAAPHLSPIESVYSVQAFLAVTGLPTLALAAIIAEQRAAEAELVASRERSARAEAAGHVGTWSVDHAHGQRLSWSEEACRIFGIAPSRFEPDTRTFHRRVHPDDAVRVVEAVRAANAGERDYEIEHRIVRDDGEIRWVHARAHVQRDAKRQVLAMVGVVRDVTDARRDARHLECQKRILGLIAQGAPLDDALEALARSVDEEIEGGACGVMVFEARDGSRTVERAVVPSLGDEFERACVGLVLSPGVASCGTAASERRTVVTRDIAAHPAWQEMRDLPLERGIRSTVSAPIVASDSGVLGTVALFLRDTRDPSAHQVRILETAANLAAIALERARASEALRAFADELEKRVADRTARLEEANRELEAFSYSVSHDLRAPLRSIDGFTGIVIEELGSNLPVDVRENLERVSASARRMGKLIDDLLTFSRLSRLPLHKTRVDPAKVAREVVADAGPELAGRRIEIRVRDMPTVHADAALLRQVYANLIGNALKFTSQRALAHVDVGADRIDRETILWVADDGVGFDMKHADKLFGVFERLHSNEEFPGTGVGLALAQRIVHRHGGRIWADAKVGEGVRFSFTLGV